MQEQPEPPESAMIAAALSDDERRKVRELFEACTPESFHLGEVLLDSLGASAADMAAVFDHTLLRRVVQSWNTGIWEHTYTFLNRCGRQRHFSALLILLYVAEPAARQNDEQQAVWHWMRNRWRPHELKALLGRHDMSESSGYQSFDQDHTPWADLSFLTELDDELADAVASSRNTVHLDGVTRLEPEQAELLARHEGWLYLNGLTDLSDSVADALARHGPHVFLEGLITLTHVGLAKKLATKPIVYLDALVSVSPEVAATLAQSGKRIFARSLNQPLPVVAGQ
jgi:hypothetical protein